MQDRDLLQAEIAHEVRQQRHLVLLVDGVAPDEVAALGEIRDANWRSRTAPGRPPGRSARPPSRPRWRSRRPRPRCARRRQICARSSRSGAGRSGCPRTHSASGRPLIPPAALISSSARSKPFFHCAPYCAYWPVSGPVTPIRIGSLPCANARDREQTRRRATREEFAAAERDHGRLQSDRDAIVLNGRPANAPDDCFDCAPPRMSPGGAPVNSTLARMAARKTGLIRALDFAISSKSAEKITIRSSPRSSASA